MLTATPEGRRFGSRWRRAARVAMGVRVLRLPRPVAESHLPG